MEELENQPKGESPEHEAVSADAEPETAVASDPDVDPEPAESPASEPEAAPDAEPAEPSGQSVEAMLSVDELMQSQEAAEPVAHAPQEDVQLKAVLSENDATTAPLLRYPANSLCRVAEGNLTRDRDHRAAKRLAY